MSDTWNKKEREKKKLQRKKEKEEKMKERKENAKEKTLADMMAYVDENGTIVSSPPDPSKKKKINVEDIEIVVPKHQYIDPADLIRTGTVTFFNEAKGFGFIKDHISEESIFVHVNGLTEEVVEKSKVSFEVQMGPRGANAVNVKLAP